MHLLANNRWWVTLFVNKEYTDAINVAYRI